ncbi:MAG: nucleotidyltransferase family protein [Rhodoferax sp.]|nr:nucleotidyltransferase family protein [Rhodoferax sp.]
MQQPTVLILASGRGERFTASGGTTHKLQARLGDLTVLQNTIAAARASGLSWHVEDAGHPGMGDSISAAVRATAQANGWLILPGDLPLIQPATLQLVAIALKYHDIVLPRYRGERGHPVGFSAACGPALMALRGDKGAAGLLRERGVHDLVLRDAGCFTDIDTVDDLERARQLLAR